MDASSIGVIFDCDGTLIDSMGVWLEVEADLGRRADATITPEDSQTIARLTIPEAGAYFHNKFGLGASGEEVVVMIDEAMMSFYGSRSCARPGALDLVRDLVDLGAHVSVASSTPRHLLEAGLSHCGFTPYLEAVLSVDDVGKSKREPAVYDRARELMGTELKYTWGVEDAIYAVNTLRNAGYHTLGIYDCDISGTYDMLDCLCTHAIRSFEEITASDLVRWTEECLL